MTGKPLIVVLGPTAVGKTSFALEIARHFATDIISADSRQLYRYMDIGTAKPTSGQQAVAHHHLIDVVNPDETLSLAQVVGMMHSSITTLHTHNQLPLLVGGTGQYLTAIEQGWSIPEVSPDNALREELETYARLKGSQALHNRLSALDADYANRIHPNNVRRVIRALEVCLISGDTMTNLQRRRPVPYRILTIGLTLERDALYARADQRVEDMLQNDLLAEVEALLTHGYSPALPSMSSIGYRELSDYLHDNITLSEAVQRIKYNTHDFIRRQEIWFRGHDNGVVWHNMTHTEPQTVIQHIETWLSE